MAIRLLTQEDFIQLWRDIFPTSYTVPIELEGDGQGFDKEQAQAAIFAAVVQAVTCQTQSYYLKRHSLQVDEPASGSVKATGTVTILRTGDVGFPAPLLAGTRVLAVQLGSYGQEIEMAEFELVQREEFPAGDTGRDVQVQAVIAGYSGNIPAGKINQFSVRGQETVPNADVIGGNTSVVQSANLAAGGQDVLRPDMVGQYIRFTNLVVFPPGPRLIVDATVATVGDQQETTVTFEPGLETPGGAVLPDVVHTVATLLSTNTEPFAIVGGEVLDISVDGILAVAVNFLGGDTTAALAVSRINAAFAAALQSLPAVVEGSSVRLNGSVLGNTGSVEIIGGTAAAILGFAVQTVFGTNGATLEIEEFSEVGFSVSQPALMSGGATAFLDAIGADRNTPRLANETDEEYRGRLCNLADIISPAAIIRICEAILSPFGISCVLKETRCINPNPTDPRFACLSGFIFDTVGDFHYQNKRPVLTNAYDLDPQFAADNGFVWVDLIDAFRYFLLCIGTGNEGEFGFAYDDAGTNPYDADVNNFYDGFPIGYFSAVSQLWNTVNDARAAGVAFEIQRLASLSAP